MTGDGISFADFYLKPKAVGIADIEEVVDSEGALIGFVKTGTEGETFIFNGDGADGGDWLGTKTTASLDANDIAQSWVRYTIRHDFSNNLWDLYIDGTLEVISLGLLADTATYLNEFVVMGYLNGAVNFDLFSLTFANPLFTDADKDGIKDAYESMHGLNPALNDRDLDPDGDGLTNIEEFLWGTFADNADSDGDTLNDSFEIENNRDPLREEADSFILGDPQLFLWLRADTGVTEGTNAGFVSEWADQSANGHDATQTNSNLQPEIVAAQANGYPVVRFDGQRDRLALANDTFSGVAEAEVFVVLKADEAEPTSDKGLWRLGNPIEGESKYPSTNGMISDNFGSAATRSASPPNDITEYHIYNVSTKPDEWINRINGTVLVESTTNSVLWKVDPKIGRSPLVSFGGDFAEIILYEEVLTARERYAVLTYLSDRYSITVIHDRDGDGLSDQWEQQYFNDLLQGSTDDPDGDGTDNLGEYNAGTDPTDYYNGVLPALSIASGNNQSGAADTYLADALVVTVTDAGDSSSLKDNAPVEFSITTGSAQLAEDSAGTGLSTTVTVKSDAQGEAKVYVLLGSTEGETVVVTAKATSGTQNTTVSFEATVTAAVNPDSDGDGLPDQWEQQYFSDLLQGATDDPDGDGTDNLGEYNAGTDPSDYYNGVLPAISIASGNNQSGDADTYLANALVVTVTDAGASSSLQVNAPVEFSITAGTAQLAEDSEGTSLDATLTVKSNAQGEATAYVLLGSTGGETIEITAKAVSGTQSIAVSFEATVTATVNPDSDGDGLPDQWEQQYFNDLVQGATDDPDGDGTDNLGEYTAGTDPSDYYNGVLPAISIASGNNQSGDTETYLASALVVSVTDAGDSSSLKDNAPVEFSITTGSAQLAEDSAGTGLGATLTVKSDAQGEAKVYVLLGSTEGETVAVTAKATSGAQSTTVSFEATVTVAATHDGDGDGLPDQWEQQYFSDLVQGATDDPDGDGDDNLAEYNAGTDPSDYYNGVLPALSIASGNNQSGDTNTYLANALVVTVADASSSSQVNAPVEFSITAGTAQLAEDSAGTGLGTTVTVKSDAQGEASAYVLLGSVAGETIAITAKATSGTQSTTVSFEATVTPDSDGDGLPDPWEQQYFSDLAQGAADDPDGDGTDNLGEYNAGTDPSDYYNAVLPALSIASGNNQSGDADTYLTDALAVTVTDAGDSSSLDNAPVEFSITTGSAQLAEDSAGTGLGATLTVKSDAQGEASVYVLLGSTEGETIEISAKVTSGTQSIAVNFEATVNSDIIIPGAVTAMGTAEVDAKVNDEQGDLRTVIMSGTGEVQIAVPLETGPKVTFYSFIFRPSVGADTANPTKLNVAGAVLDFPRYANADNIMSGYIQALDGASGGNNWIHTGIFYGLRALGEAKVPLLLTLRLDSVAGVWDLYFGNRLWVTDLDYIAGADMIMISSGSEFYTTFGAIKISKSNPLFVDINKDGLPDSFEIAQGYTPTANNRDALVTGTTTSLLEHYLDTL